MSRGRSSALVLRARSFALAAVGLASVVVFGGTEVARADGARRTVRVRIVQGSACADPGELRRALDSRGVTVASDEHAWANVEIDVHDIADGPLEGRMTLHAEGHPDASRVVRASTCEEVLGTLAFAIALATEPVEGAEGPAPGPSASATAPTPSATPAPASAPAPTPTPAPAPAPSPPRPSPPARWSFGVSASGGVQTGAAPNVAPTFALAGEVGYGAGVFDPQLRLAVGADLPTTSADVVASRFARQYGRLDACPVRLGDRLAFRPCARFELGRIQAKALESTGARLAEATWAASFLVAHVRFDIAGPFFVFGEAGAGVALARSDFAFGATEVYGVPAILGTAAAGLGMHFP